MYLEFETRPDLEFEFYLAQKLHMTVARLRDEMSGDEFMRWNTYYARESQRRDLEQRRAEAWRSR